MEKKFNKANVSDLIQDEISRLQRKHCFKPDWGANQVRGKGEDTVMDYGKYEALCSLHEQLFENDRNFYVIH